MLILPSWASGWVGPETFLLPGIRNRSLFIKEALKYFPDSQVLMTDKGYMNEKAFIEWADFFTKKIRDIRGDRELWCLLVLYGYHSHTSSPKALQILNDNKILLISLPSHSTNLLQVHDIAIFHPLKERFRSSLMNWMKDNGLSLKLENFREILSPAWEAANSSITIKNGFRSAGLWPLNKNWVYDNKDKLKFKTNSLSPLEKFEKSRRR